MVFIMLLIVVSMLGACSSKPKKDSLSVKVTDENKTYLSQYNKSLQGFIKEQTSILDTFNDAVDGLYTQKYSKEQFASILTTSIDKSSTLVKEVGSLDVSPDIFEAHQNLILLVNRSHQLLLSAIDMANSKDKDIDKDSLRSQYVDIKTEQAKIANQWKVLRIQLETGKANKHQ
jgi:hypothetical protein